MVIKFKFSSSKDPIILFNLLLEPCLLTPEVCISTTEKKYGEAFMPVGSCFNLLLDWLQFLFQSVLSLRGWFINCSLTRGTIGSGRWNEIRKEKPGINPSYVTVFVKMGQRNCLLNQYSTLRKKKKDENHLQSLVGVELFFVQVLKSSRNSNVAFERNVNDHHIRMASRFFVFCQV